MDIMKMPPAPYTPGPLQDWATISPADAGFDPTLLAAAIAFHRQHETAWPTSMYLADGRYVGTAYIGDKPEHAEVIGPVRPRGGPNGLILRGGRIVAEWGDTARPDMTFSIAKSYLGILTGLAVADGLIADIDRPVGADDNNGWFEGPRLAAITWRHLLQQTSEWQGTLWGKPDSADHNRVVGGTAGGDAHKGEARVLGAPGTHFEYNDVRVNLLAACLTHRFRQPLPSVLKARIMDPIGASAGWGWHHYRDACLDLDGQAVACVPGGGHWGGGMTIGSRDHARAGLLIARGGAWNGRQLIPADWVEAMFAPSPCNDQYGMMWWLNSGANKRYPSATEAGRFALGAGASLIWIEPAHDLVVVIRWIAGEAADGFMGHVLAALKK
jgi:CubicO group peptidase (beta-lactamase class C family)